MVKKVVTVLSDAVSIFNKQLRLHWVLVKSSGGYFLVMDYWGCAAGWGRIFTTLLY